MVKHTLKLLWCKNRKIIKYIWPFFNIIYEILKSYLVKCMFKIFGLIISLMFSIFVNGGMWNNLQN